MVRICVGVFNLFFSMVLKSFVGGGEAISCFGKRPMTSREMSLDRILLHRSKSVGHIHITFTDQITHLVRTSVHEIPLVLNMAMPSYLSLGFSTRRRFPTVSPISNESLHRRT
jgi:hypothetical protein